MPFCKLPPLDAGFSSQTSRSPPPPAALAFPPLPCSASSLSFPLSQQPAFFSLAAGAKLTSLARDLGRDLRLVWAGRRRRSVASTPERGKRSCTGACLLLQSRRVGHPGEFFLPLLAPKRSVSSSLLIVWQTLFLFSVGATRVGGKGAVERACPGGD